MLESVLDAGKNYDWQSNILYESINPQLNAIEEKRLEYARKHLREKE